MASLREMSDVNGETRSTLKEAANQGSKEEAFPRFSSTQADLAPTDMGRRCLETSLFASDNGDYFYTVRNTWEQDREESEECYCKVERV